MEVCHGEKNNLNDHKHVEEMDKLELRTNNQMSHMQRVEREPSEYFGHDEKTNLNDHKHVAEMDTLQHRTPNQMSHVQSVEKGTSEYIQSSQHREELLHRTRQSKNNISHCVTSNYSKYEKKTDMDDIEEVIDSEGEPFEGYQYPNNTWDSDDSLYEEDYSTKTGWI